MNGDRFQSESTGILKNNFSSSFNTHCNYSALSLDENESNTSNPTHCWRFTDNKVLASLASFRFYLCSYIDDWWNSYYISNYLRAIGVVLSAFALLTFSSAERITFKIAVDHMKPNNAILIQIIYVFLWLLYGCIAIYKSLFTKEITPAMTKFPHSNIFMMALFDTISFYLMIVSAAYVYPTMTVILLQSSIPTMLIFSKYIFPERNYGNNHSLGIILISAAILTAILKSVANDILTHSIWNSIYSIMYAFAAGLQGLGSIYKEKSLTDFGRAVNIYYLSAWLFFYQVILAIIILLMNNFFKGNILSHRCYDVVDPLMCAAVFRYSKESYGTLLMHQERNGWQCFLYGPSSESNDHSNNEMDLSHDRDEQCLYTNWITLSFIVSSLLIVLIINNHSIQISRIIQERTVLAALIISFISLWIYDEMRESSMSDFDDNPVNGQLVAFDIGSALRSIVITNSHVNLFDIVSLFVLIMGMEIYNREPDPSEEVVTSYDADSSITIRSSSIYNSIPFTNEITEQHRAATRKFQESIL